MNQDQWTARLRERLRREQGITGGYAQDLANLLWVEFQHEDPDSLDVEPFGE